MDNVHRRWGGRTRAPLLITIATAALAGIAVWRVTQERAPMNTSVADVPPLSADLVPFIGEPDVSLVLARITRVELERRTGGDPDREVGAIHLDVLETLADRGGGAGGTIVVPARRVADPATRRRNAFDHWNVVSLDPDDVLILALRPTGEPGHFLALGATEVESGSSPDVGAVRECVTIERQPTGDARRRMLEAALGHSADVVARYAADALQRRLVLGRDTGTAVLERGIDGEATTPERKLELASVLQELFDAELKVDPGNERVVATLARRLEADGDPDRRGAWATLLAASLLTEFTGRPEVDRQIQAALIRKVQQPGAAVVIGLLAELAEREPGNEQFRALIRAWRSAAPGA